jgi:hypothetical protein
MSEDTLGRRDFIRLAATSDPAHMRDNVLAGFGRLPDAAERRRMVDYIERI